MGGGKGGKGGKKGGRGGKGMFADSADYAQKKREQLEAFSKKAHEGMKVIWFPRVFTKVQRRRARAEGEDRRNMSELQLKLDTWFDVSKEWNAIERHLPTPANVYNDAETAPVEVQTWRSMRTRHAASCVPFLESVYRGKLGGGCPPPPGAHPETWPDDSGEGLWPLYYPQELVVDSLASHLAGLKRRRGGASTGGRAKRRRVGGTGDDQAEDEDDEMSDADGDYAHDHYGDEDASESFGEGPDED